ncbi:MAG TPA: acyl-CoA dehydrogenase [Phenylobacterium sp.]|uniref:acyl-CoA dehydrogenase n=1 Tax=Phenylobacterium sp. TaxID=1871053 RepID=UPI002B4A90E8|nr:acyl-CoA dehydrogenase [Phenylobacterium sp.]HKR90417.1 acyl-CoA dehydrogenase [Phenylobacterium sp.]
MAGVATPVVNRRDLDFLLFEWLRLEELLERPRFSDHAAEEIRSIVQLVERVAEQELAPHLRASDLDEPRLDPEGQVRVLPDVARAVRTIAEAGIFGSAFDTDLGGSQLPNLVHVACLGLLMGGSISASSFMLLTVANARLIVTYGTPRQITAFAQPQVAGSTLGTMCLSEPHAGSSLADIRTRAVADGEDEFGPRYRLFGAKMWISAGDHDVTDNIVHLVLAKTEGPDGMLAEGTRGASLFIVPKVLPDGSRNDIVVAGLNHKMGYRALPNCALNFGEGATRPFGQGGAVGWRVGDVGQGLPQMFQMMNEARISVGLGGAMLAYRGYLLSLDYARNRVQGRPPGVHAGEQVAIIQHADVRRMLLAQKCYAEGALALVLYCARLLDEAETAPSAEARAAAANLLSLLTPVTKSWPSEWAQISLHHAIQIHGGAGYTRDFDVELLYRDNRLNPIHEGTTGIQAIDLVGRKIRRDRGEGFQNLLRPRIEATLRGARSAPGLEREANALQRVWTDISQAVTKLQQGEAQDALAHATAFLEALGHGVVGWLWLDQAVLCRDATLHERGRPDASFRAGKLRACRYFSEFELPKIAGWLAPLMAGARVVMDAPPEEFVGD